MPTSLTKAVYHFLSNKNQDTINLTHVLKNWETIVGEYLSHQALPVHYNKSILTIAPSLCDKEHQKNALEIEYKKPIYKEKINDYYGNCVVQKMRVKYDV